MLECGLTFGEVIVWATIGILLVVWAEIKGLG